MNPQERKEFENATARPWEVHGASIRKDGLGPLASAPNARRGGVANCIGCPRSGKNDPVNVTARANAELIVTAVNERPQLLERVRVLTDLLKGCRVAFEGITYDLGPGTEGVTEMVHKIKNTSTQAIQNIDKVIE